MFILHFYRHRWIGPSTYEASWACPDALTEIRVSSQMVSHHMPDVVYKALRQLAEQSYSPHHLLSRQVPTDSAAPARNILV